MEETTPRTSAKWRPTTTFAADVTTQSGKLSANLVEDVEKHGSALA